MREAKIQERRTHPRAGPFDGTWSGTSGASGVRISDVSEGGCFVESLVVPPLDEPVAVMLALPLGGELRVDGHVTTVDPGIGFAVQFGELRTEQRTKIRGAVQHVLTGGNTLMATISPCSTNGEGPKTGLRELRFAG